MGSLVLSQARGNPLFRVIVSHAGVEKGPLDLTPESHAWDATARMERLSAGGESRERVTSPHRGDAIG